MGSAPVVDLTSARFDLPCLLCGGARRTVMHEKKPFQIVRCADCSLVFTLPRLTPAALKEMYQSAYWKSDAAKDFGYTDYLGDEQRYVRTFLMRGAWIARQRQPPGRLLDVGCAAGFAMTALEQLGYDVHGVEISQPMAEIARRKFGADHVHCGVLEEVEQQMLFGGGPFDVITMFDVVEHIEDPIAFLAAARRLLAPGGIVVLETQNVASRFAKLLGVKWQHYKFQEHLYHFDPRTIRLLLAKAGLELVTWSPRRGGKYISFGFLIERAARVSKLLAALLKPLSPLRDKSLYVNVFDEMLVVARAAPSAAAADPEAPPTPMNRRA